MAQSLLTVNLSWVEKGTVFIWSLCSTTIIPLSVLIAFTSTYTHPSIHLSLSSMIPTTDSTNKLTNSSLIVLPQPHNLIYNRMFVASIRSDLSLSSTCISQQRQWHALSLKFGHYVQHFHYIIILLLHQPTEKDDWLGQQLNCWLGPGFQLCTRAHWLTGIDRTGSRRVDHNKARNTDE